jgi:hypothetical protein
MESAEDTRIQKSVVGDGLGIYRLEKGSISVHFLTGKENRKTVGILYEGYYNESIIHLDREKARWYYRELLKSGYLKS